MHVCRVFLFCFLTQVPTEDRLSPARQSPQSRNAETPSTLSTSPGESRGWNDARISSHSVGEGAPGIKRQCHGRTLQRPPLPPPPRQHSLPQGGGDRQVPQRAATGGTLGTTKGVPNPQRRGPRGKDGTGSPYDPHASGRAGVRCDHQGWWCAWHVCCVLYLTALRYW